MRMAKKVKLAKIIRRFKLLRNNQKLYDVEISEELIEL